MENSKEYELIVPPHLNPTAVICLQQPLVVCLCFASNVLGSALDPNCKLDPCLKKKPLAQCVNHLRMSKKGTKKDAKGWILCNADTELLYPPKSTILREVINSIESIRALKPQGHPDTNKKKKKKATQGKKATV